MIELKDITISWLSVVLVIMSFIQIAPIKINPWSFILKRIAEAIIGDMLIKIDELTTDVKVVEENLERQVAISCRSRILVFGDEIIRGTEHSKEHFHHILNDITLYEQYCDDNPHFINNMTKLTAERIKETYSECMMKNTFL